MMMYQRLQQFQQDGDPIRVALVGAGAMGVGIAYQVARTPGMELVSVTDIRIEAARKAAEAADITGEKAYRIVSEGDDLSGDDVLLSTSPFFLLDKAEELGLDVLVEATNTIGFAAEVCMRSIEQGLHVILMNAEVDLAVGPILNQAAAEHGVTITSDAGDQHGVLARMIDEIRLWDFDIVMAGNIKGFLNRYATAESLEYEARIRNLSPIQCTAYTDGSKLSVEMAVIANGEGLVPYTPGMEGPRASDVRDVFHLFDFDKYGDTGVVDYILGAQPGGGVFVVGRCEDSIQQGYLRYYKMGNGPYYLFYRPYHLCHLETTRAIASAALDNRALLTPVHGRLTDVYAFAKRDIEPGEVVDHGIGGDLFYGLIEKTSVAEPENRVPITLLEAEGEKQAVVARPIRRDAPLIRSDIELPNTYLTRLFADQEALLVS